jgi:hypothetical protein
MLSSQLLTAYLAALSIANFVMTGADFTAAAITTTASLILSVPLFIIILTLYALFENVIDANYGASCLIVCIMSGVYTFFLTVFLRLPDRDLRIVMLGVISSILASLILYPLRFR